MMAIDSRRWRAFFVAVLVAVVTVGCGDNPGSVTRNDTPTTKAAFRPTEVKARTSSPADADGPVGVAACDEWVEKYLVCIDGKAPEAARAQMKIAVGQTKGTWRKTAETANGRAALATACTRMVESTRQATASFGCEW